jgi:predicted Zn-dependent protease
MRVILSRWSVLVCAAGLGFSACTTVHTTQPGVVGVERAQTMSPLVSEAQMRQGAQEAYQQVLAQARAKNQLNRDAAQIARVRQVAQRIIAQTGTFRADAPGWPWEINVISAPQANAWVMPGGKMAVYSGLIDKLDITDAELAAVIGHEVAHALREHQRERASQALTQSIVLGALGAAAGASQGTLDLAQLVMQVTLDLPHSRAQETEADRIGVELSARAGYDPRAAVTLWQKMDRMAQSGPPEFLSTHPSSASRIHDLQEYAARVMPLYQARR